MFGPRMKFLKNNIKVCDFVNFLILCKQNEQSKCGEVKGI
jgi:hypothetical protein